MIDPLWLAMYSYFASALWFDTLLIQLNDTWTFLRLFTIFFCGIEETGNSYYFSEIYALITFPTIYSLSCFPLKWHAYEV